MQVRINNMAQLYPKRFFDFFDDICKIPHGSGNEDGIVAYLTEFASSNNLSCYTDKNKNVLITKSATAGYEHLPPIALQGHTDMVCQKTADSTHDFLTAPIEWYIDGEYIKAKDTSLGADDGAAVCMMLCLLESQTIEHPKLHCLFTSEEETGLLGAETFDYSKISDAKYMINIDGEEEWEVLCSCAGGARLNLTKSYETCPSDTCVKISLDGLCGGHSGADIHKNRINANIALAELLDRVFSVSPFDLCEFVGGTVDNAISSCAYCVISGVTASQISDICDTYKAQLLDSASDEDKGFALIVEDTESRLCADRVFTREFISCILGIKCGVVKMSEDVDGLVQTSANIGVVELKNGSVDIHISIRSSVEDEKHDLCDFNAQIGKKYGFSAVSGHEYPGWNFKKDSALRPLYSQAFSKTHGGKMPMINAIHAGLECGIISGHLPDLDIIAIGPEMSGVHSPAEKLDISSVGRIYDTIVELLKSLRQ